MALAPGVGIVFSAAQREALGARRFDHIRGGLSVVALRYRDQDWTVRFAHDALRDRAEHESADPGAVVRTEHDQIRVDVGRRLQHFVDRQPDAQMFAD